MAEAGVRVPLEQVKVSAVSDERVDFLREQAFTVLRLKTDKWNRFIGLEENQRALLDFLDQSWRKYLILFMGPGGTLHAGDEQVSIFSFFCHVVLLPAFFWKCLFRVLCTDRLVVHEISPRLFRVLSLLKALHPSFPPKRAPRPGRPNFCVS